jgi:DNA invertase Pin-like site-specific DNA recombinase
MVTQRAPGAPALAYYRVSTQRQGRSGLGLEAQREAVERFAEREGYEIESGKGADALDRRPILAAAMARARRARCPIVVAKLDRLSRDVHFVSGLMVHKEQLRGTRSQQFCRFLNPARCQSGLILGQKWTHCQQPLRV